MKAININSLEYKEGFRCGYLRACKQFDKEVEALKGTMLMKPSPKERGEFILWLEKEIDKIFTHKEAQMLEAEE